MPMMSATEHLELARQLEVDPAAVRSGPSISLTKATAKSS
jgi:hypothetical protein